ncbi:MAG: ISNCY family transposase [Deltaproteobacteria bacterium]|nr:ISNCY family transposase [Deltaproteobacteria bacterium]
MGTEVTLRMKELKRYGVIQSLMSKKMTNAEAAACLGLSTRQIIRIKKKVMQKGPLGILHGNRGRPPVHACSPELRGRVIQLAKSRYFDFNFSHLSEILAEEEGICLSRETIRRFLRSEGLGRKVRKQRTHRTRRQRSSKEGQMLFLDGSRHLWFGQQSSWLILCTDDATGKPLLGLFQEEEDLDGCFRVCLEVFSRHGLPTSFYLDRASQFTTTRHGGLHVAQRDDKPTHFERAMQELGIHLIFSHSPQGRGRAERINGTLQDRLVAELRLKGISSKKDATHYLNHHFIPRYNQRFALPPADQLQAWRPVPEDLDLKNILCRRRTWILKTSCAAGFKEQWPTIIPSPSMEISSSFCPPQRASIL